MMVSDALRFIVGALFYGVAAFEDVTTRRVHRALWLGLAPFALIMLYVEPERPDRGVYSVISIVASLALVLAWRRGALADRLGLGLIPVLLPYPVGLGPPAWIFVVVLALFGSWVWRQLREPGGGVPFLAPVFGALVIRGLMALVS